MKAFTKFLTVCAVLLATTSCEKCDHHSEEPKLDKITFSFTLQCSEDLLDFIVPSATFVNAEDEECTIVVPKSQFVKQDVTGLVGNEDAIYNWEKQILLLGTTTAQRDMRVTYKIKESHPQIDMAKTYAMMHKLNCSTKKETTNGTTVVTDATSVEIIIGENSTIKIEGSELQNYLNKLEENPDYIKREVR